MTIPAPLIDLVIDATIGDVAALLPWEVESQAVAEAEGNHTLLPVLESHAGRRVATAVIKHKMQAPAEVSVARGREGWDE